LPILLLRWYVINLLNFQQELPNIPIFNLRLRIKTNGKQFTKVLILPEEVFLPYEIKDNYIEVKIPRLETFLMLGIYY